MVHDLRAHACSQRAMQASHHLRGVRLLFARCGSADRRSVGITGCVSKFFNGFESRVRTMRPGVLVLAALAFAVATCGAASGAVPQSWAAREAVATAEADRLLAGMELPRGAASSTSEPAGDGGRLAIPPGRYEHTGLLEQHGWWVIPGPPLAALDYLHEHSTELADVEGWRPFKNETGAEVASARLPEGTGVIGERWLRFTAVALPDGSTGVRVDAQVLWLLPRNRIPGGTRLLRIDVRRVRPGHPPPVVFNIRSMPRIARIVLLLNSLPVARPSLLVRPCPPPHGTVRLAFYRKPSEPPQALVAFTIGDCGGADAVIRGKPRQPGLEADDFFAALERILGRKLRLFP